MRRASTLLALALAGGALAASGPALPHHSFSMFDSKKQVTLTGTVRTFEWTNPHSWLQLETGSGAGKVEWSIELGSPNTMVRQGWRRTTFKPGDKVTVVINPMRDGSPGGAFLSATAADGRALP